MRIDPTGTIAGRRSLEIRDLLRHGRNGLWTPEFVAERLGSSEAEAQRVIDELLLAGYIELDESFSGRVHWVNTLEGNALAQATAAKPVTRATAEKNVTAFLDRVRQVNEDEYFLYRVTRVVVFGSYLTDQNKLNDVDLGVELEPKYSDRDVQRKHEQERIQQALNEGRTFRHYVAQLTWPEHETQLFLKSRSRTISLHDISDPIQMQAEYRTLFPEQASACFP